MIRKQKEGDGQMKSWDKSPMPEKLALRQIIQARADQITQTAMELIGGVHVIEKKLGMSKITMTQQYTRPYWIIMWTN